MSNNLSSLFRVIQGIVQIAGRDNNSSNSEQNVTSTFIDKKSKRGIDVSVINDKPILMNTTSDDSFGRIKVAPPHLLFDASFQYTLQDKVFIRSELNNATITHDLNRAAARLETSIDVGSRARLRSRNYFPYSPAFTNTMIGSFCFHGSIENVTKRLGLYDEKNGFFIQVRGEGFEVGIRSSITGSVVDNIVEQSNWNVDKLDGSGNKITNPSGLYLDPTKQNIIYLEFQWLGSGRVQFAFIINGEKVVAHEFQHANILDSLYSQTATLPIQAEILGNGISSFMEFTCCSLAANGATSQHGHLYVASNGVEPITAQTVGTVYPIISIRKQTAYSKIPVQILDISAFSTTNDDFLIQIIHKAVLNTPVWVNIPGSLCEKDVSSTSLVGGDLVAEFYMKGNLQASEKLELLSRFWDLTLGDDFDGNSEIMTMAAIPLTTNAGIYGVISFKVYEW